MWDAIYAWLLTTYLPTLSGLSANTVFDGTPLTQDQLLTYAAVGEEDPSGFADGDYDEIDALVAESGEIAITFVSRSGDDDLAPHRTTTKAWVDALRTYVKANQTLGGLLMQGSTVTVGRVETRQQKTSGGVRVERAVSLRYFTRL